MKALTAILGLCLVAGVAAAQQLPIINEFVNNHTGTDTYEFVEVFGTPNTDLSYLTILEIEGSSTLGVIDGVFNVGTTNAEGFWTTDFMSNVNILPLIIPANIICFTRLAFKKYLVDGITMIFNIQPIPDLLSISIYRNFFSRFRI